MSLFKPTLCALAITLILTATNGKIFAQSKVDCSKATSQAEINTCTQNQFLATDKELNTIYKKVIVKLDGEQKEVLIQSQRKWLSFRDDYSKIYQLLYKGGSSAASAVLQCKTDLTRARITELKSLLDQVDL